MTLPLFERANYLDIKFHQYVTYVLAGCLENIFWNYRKLGFFVHTKNVKGFFLSKPCHIDKLRLVKFADEFLTTLQSGLSITSQKVVKYVSHDALLNSERGSNGGQRAESK